MSDRLHTPRVCSSCPAPIFWAQVLDENGQRVRREDGRFKSMPVNAQPDPRGNVVLFHRPGEGIVCRVLRKGEEPPPTWETDTDPIPMEHYCPRCRRKRGERGGKGR